ncbi:hypothetical protein ACFFGV_09765 [Pontibacillus salicampi]|uniref:SCP2 domain-containing protein n=1 Tax=Pontibacillus salicampi TaxID=1449801 RepID=A0ABV6LN48_9BACI
MDKEVLQNWVERIESRSDLFPLVMDKTLSVAFFSGEEQLFVIFTNGSCITSTSAPNQLDIMIEAKPFILKDIWQGTCRLLSVPNHLIKMNGSYKNLLWIESLFHLARPL